MKDKGKYKVHTGGWNPPRETYGIRKDEIETTVDSMAADSWFDVPAQTASRSLLRRLLAGKGVSLREIRDENGKLIATRVYR